VICNNCQVAADIITRGREAGFKEEEVMTAVGRGFEGTPTASILRSVASLFHGICKGSGHCDCQHIIDWSGNKTVQR
jgi:hypothetical protein